MIAFGRNDILVVLSIFFSGALAVLPIAAFPHPIGPDNPHYDCQGYEWYNGMTADAKQSAMNGYAQCEAHARYLEEVRGLKVEPGTKAIYFNPFAHDVKLSPTLVRASGICRSGSYVTSSVYAYRCEVGNAIYDPCYTEALDGVAPGRPTKSTLLRCFYSVTGVFAEIRAAVPENDVYRVNPLRILCTDGKTYYSHPGGTSGPGTSFIQSIDVSKPLWIATISTPNVERRVQVTLAYF